MALGDQIGDVGETNAVDDQKAYSKLKRATTPTSSDLDHFMVWPLSSRSPVKYLASSNSRWYFMRRLY